MEELGRELDTMRQQILQLSHEAEAIESRQELVEDHLGKFSRLASKW